MFDPRLKIPLLLLLFWTSAAHAVEVSQAVLCRKIVKRAPDGVSSRFPAEVGQVYAHLTLANRGEPTKVNVVWRFKDERVARTDLKVGYGSRWRTWAKLRINPNREGPWSVEVIDAEGRRLAYVPFVVGAAGDAPPAPVLYAAKDAPRRVKAPETPPSMPEVAAPQPAEVKAKAGCRALVNVRVDGNGGVRYYSGEVTIGEGKPRVRTVRGLVVQDNSGTYALNVVRKVAEDTGKGGEVVRRWDQLMGVRLPDGKPSVWYAYPATLAAPSRTDKEFNPQRFVEENLLELESVLGPYVGLRASLAGFAGGAHGFDHSRFATVRPPGKRVDVPKLVTGDLVNMANLRAAELRARTLTNPPLAARHDFRRATLTSTPKGLRLKTLIRCCSWAENRGLLEVDIALEKTPTAVRAFAPDADGWHAGPNECASIRGTKDGLQLQTPTQDFDDFTIAQRSGERLLGVRWLGPDDVVPDAEVMGQALERMKK